MFLLYVLLNKKKTSAKTKATGYLVCSSRLQNQKCKQNCSLGLECPLLNSTLLLIPHPSAGYLKLPAEFLNILATYGIA